MKKILKQLVILGLSIGCVLTIISPTVSAYSIPEDYMPSNVPFNLNFEEADATEAPEGPLMLILQILSGTLLYVAAPLAVISIVLAAFKLVTSGGAAESIETGKKHITWAIIGLLVIIFSYAIVSTIITITFESFNQAEGTEESQEPLPQSTPATVPNA